MNIITETLNSTRVGEAQVYGNLALHPLLKDDDAAPDYALLDDAIAKGFARITEVSDDGSIPELKFENDSPTKILLLDGEELVGAKQNRILNISVMASANLTTLIPVSCVEAGRWGYVSKEFAPAGRAHYAEARAKNRRSVNETMRKSGSRRGNQGEVWHEIDTKLVRMSVVSHTQAAEDLYIEKRANLDEYQNAFKAMPKQIGALFAIDGIIAGVDLFDCASTLEATLPKLIESYAMDAIDTGATRKNYSEEETAEDFIRRISGSESERHDGVGEGFNYTFDSENLAGGALVVDDRLVHLCAFQVEEQDTVRKTPRSRIARNLRQPSGRSNAA